MSIATTYLLNVALQAVILSIFASLVLRFMRQARHRSITAIAGLLAVGFLPWLTALRPAPPVTATVPKIETQALALPTWTVAIMPAKVDQPAPAGPGEVPTTFVFPETLTSIVTIWAVGSGIAIAMLGLALMKVRIFRKSLRLPDDAAWRILRDLAPEFTPRNHFLISKSTSSPCVTGFWRPKLVIPAFLLEEGSEEGLRWAMRHEIAHWQAGDSRWMILFALIRGTNWWNPLVHRIVTNWADAREQLCDLQATGVSENRADYGRFLVAMAGRITRQPPLAVAMAKRLHALRLERRIVCLLGAGTGSENPVGKSFVGASSAVFVGFAILVSVLKIGAEEPARDAGIAAESEPVGRQTGTDLADDKSSPFRSREHPRAIVPEKPAPQAVMGKPVSQLKFTNKLLMTAARPTTKGGALLTDDEDQFYMRTLAVTKGVHLMTAPSVTAKFGQAATIEIIREVLGSARQIAARDPKSPAPFIGIRLAISADLVDDQISLKFDPEYHFIPGLDLSLGNNGNKPPPGADPDKIKIAKRDVIARLSAGQTLCTDLGEIEPGKFLQIFTHVVPLDARGRPLDSFKNGKLLPEVDSRNKSNPTRGGKIPDGTTIPPDALPSSNVNGKLRLNAVLVEIPLKTPRPAGDGLVIGLTPSDSKVAASIQNTPNAKVRKLEIAEMPLNKRGIPWPEFPGLSVSAIASKDFKLITITSHAVGDGVGEFPNTWEELRAGSTMNFGIKTKDTMLERRLLITIEAVK